MSGSKKVCNGIEPQAVYTQIYALDLNVCILKQSTVIKSALTEI